MKKILAIILCIGFLMSAAWAQENTSAAVPAGQTLAQRKAVFKARRKQIRKLVKKYKTSAPDKQAAIKTELEKLVSDQVDDGFLAMQDYLTQERAKLDNLEQKMKTDQADLAGFKAQRVADLLTGEAKQKHKAAKKAWKAQIKEFKNRFR